MRSGLPAAPAVPTTGTRLRADANCPWRTSALRLSPFPRHKLGSSDRPGAVKGARWAWRSEPLTARTDLESFEARERGFRPS